MAGYIGSPRQWISFRSKWNPIIRRHGVKEFSSNQFFGRLDPKQASNPYRDWPPEKADAFLDSLLAVIHNGEIWPLGIGIDIGAFERLTYGERGALAGYFPTPSHRRRKVIPEPYHAALRIMIGEAIDRVAPKTKVHFYFDEQEQHRQRARDAVDAAKASDYEGMEHRLGQIHFEESIGWPGLQAADLLAHQWYNVRLRGRLYINAENKRTMDALTRRRADMKHMDAAAMERIFTEHFTPEERPYLRSIPEPARRT